MTLDEFTRELDAKFASMSDDELKSALRKAGFEFEDDCVVEAFWNEASFWDDGQKAADSNELALAA